MRIDCPSCQTSYAVPDAALAVRRTMRCARCGAEFSAGGEAVAAVVEPVAVPRVVAEPAAVEVEVPRVEAVEAAVEARGVVSADGSAVRMAVAAGWVVSVLVLVGLGWSAVAWRGAVVRAWPAASRGYALVGFR